MRTPIYHRSGRYACHRRIADKDEVLLKLPIRVRDDVPNVRVKITERLHREAQSLLSFMVVTVSQQCHDLVCMCNIRDTPTFTSQPNAIDLQWYDKGFDKRR